MKLAYILLHLLRRYKRRRLTVTRQPRTINSRMNYLISPVAPASINFFNAASASALLTPSLIALGAPSTKSLASFKPNAVNSSQP